MLQDFAHARFQRDAGGERFGDLCVGGFEVGIEREARTEIVADHEVAFGTRHADHRGVKCLRHVEAERGDDLDHGVADRPLRVEDQAVEVEDDGVDVAKMFVAHRTWISGLRPTCHGRKMPTTGAAQDTDDANLFDAIYGIFVNDRWRYYITPSSQPAVRPTPAPPCSRRDSSVRRT